MQMGGDGVARVWAFLLESHPLRVCLGTILTINQPALPDVSGWLLVTLGSQRLQAWGLKAVFCPDSRGDCYRYF